MHVVVSLIREDGTKAEQWMDRNRAQAACRELEEEYGLTRVAAGFGAKTTNPREVTSAKAEGRPEAKRDTLRREVRAAVALSGSEGEFVTRLREAGVLVFPRFHETEPRAVGYSVALPPKDGEKVVRFPGMKLGNDMGLGSIRNVLGDSPAARKDALRAWLLAAEGKPPEDVYTRAGLGVDSRKMMAQSASGVEAMRSKMERMAPDNYMEWGRTAATLSGWYGAWGKALGGEDGAAMMRVSDELGRASQVSRSAARVVAPRPPQVPMMGAAVAAYRRGERQGAFEVLAQMHHLTVAVYRHVKARDDVAKAGSLRASSERDMAALWERMAEYKMPEQRVSRGPSAAPSHHLDPVHMAPPSPSSTRGRDHGRGM